MEENQVQLQSMMASKFIGHFFKEISGWQKTLGVVDQVITLWFDVQRTWAHLESIFVGSEDIRQQLPIDSERFDNTNERFVAKLKVITRKPNIIEATSTPGLAEELEVGISVLYLHRFLNVKIQEIQSQLSLFEKALAEYLETKRLAFPRLEEENLSNLEIFQVLLCLLRRPS